VPDRRDVEGVVVDEVECRLPDERGGGGEGGVVVGGCGRGSARLPDRVWPLRAEEGRAEQGGVDAGVDHSHPVHPGAAGGEDGDIVPTPGEPPGEVDQEGLHAAELGLGQRGDERGDEGDAHAIRRH
jgi:hypothetical protein